MTPIFLLETFFPNHQSFCSSLNYWLPKLALVKDKNSLSSHVLKIALSHLIGTFSGYGSWVWPSFLLRLFKSFTTLSSSTQSCWREHSFIGSGKFSFSFASLSLLLPSLFLAAYPSSFPYTSSLLPLSSSLLISTSFYFSMLHFLSVGCWIFIINYLYTYSLFLNFYLIGFHNKSGQLSQFSWFIPSIMFVYMYFGNHISDFFSLHF